MTALTIRLGDDGELLRLQSTLDQFPEHADRARTRALRTLSPWLQRETLRAASRASGIEPTVWQALARFRTLGREDAIGVWLGTNAIPAHHLGDVAWSRRQPGATAGGRAFPGTWSWQSARRTKGLIMRRHGTERLPIDVVYWEIHAEVLDAIEGLAPAINARYQTLMTRELERALQEAA